MPRSSRSARAFLKRCYNGPSSQACRKAVLAAPAKTKISVGRGESKRWVSPKNGRMRKQDLKKGRTGRVVSKRVSDNSERHYHSPDGRIRIPIERYWYGKEEGERNDFEDLFGDDDEGPDSPGYPSPPRPPESQRKSKRGRIEKKYFDIERRTR